MVRSKSWKRSSLSFSERRIERPALLTTKSTWSKSCGDLLGQGVDGVEVGEVAGVDVRRTALPLDQPPGRLELLGAAGDQDRDGAGLGDLDGGDQADARRGAGDHDGLVGQRLDGRGVVLDRVVEHLLPVGPQQGGVGLQVGHRDAGARRAPSRSSARRRSRGRRRGPSTAGGMPSRPMVCSSSAVTGAVRRAAPSRVVGRRALGEQVGGHPAGDAAVDRHGELRGLRGRGERVDQPDRALRLGVDEVERLAVEAGLVGDVVHRLGDVVDRHHVGVAEVDRRPAASSRAGCRASA